ncbi:MAG: hypothetical protein FJ102_00370 [Deltaproteobacteria bacterium]|nr:hypothetical protein [Deltaproteobacteria bacterium]
MSPSTDLAAESPDQPRAVARPGCSVEAGGWFPTEGVLTIGGERWHRAADPAVVAGLRVQLDLDPSGLSISAAARRTLTLVADADWTVVAGLGGDLVQRGPFGLSAGLMVGATHETWQTAIPVALLVENPAPTYASWLPLAEGWVTLAWPRQSVFQGVARGGLGLATVVDVGDEWSSGWSALLVPGAAFTLGVNYVAGHRRLP